MKSIHQAGIGLFLLSTIVCLPAYAHETSAPIESGQKRQVHLRETDEGLFLDGKLFFSTAYADEAPAPAVAKEGIPAVGAAGDALSNIASKIPVEGVVVVLLVGVYDFVRRKWPTKNPASFWRDFKKLIGGMIALLGKLDQLGDKIFGQNSQSK